MTVLADGISGFADVMRCSVVVFTSEIWVFFSFGLAHVSRTTNMLATLHWSTH